MGARVWFIILGVLSGLIGCALGDGRSIPGSWGAHPVLETAASYYIVGSPEHRKSLEDLFLLLSTEGEAGEERFAVVQEIAMEYARQKEYGRLINFLTSWVTNYPEDPYTAYYLLMTAYAYNQQEASTVAALYFERIIKNYPDLLVRGESVHYICLNHLITLVKNQEQLVRYYEALISRFADKIDLGTANFMLAQAYEQMGEWNSAIQAYTRFLPYYGTVIPGFPDAYTYAKQIVDFNHSSKDWTFESLGSLVTAVQAALEGGSSFRLWQYQAKVNFFARSWEQEDEDKAGAAEFNLSDFMRGNRIRYAATLDAGSNANEAYLRTWGWSQYLSTWYFYFRKIYFPLDPEIHGRWEWAGVYYGEKL